MNNYNLLLSKEKFYQQQFTTIKNAISEKINEYYANKKNSRKINLASIGFWIALPLAIIGTLLMLIATGILVYVLFWAKDVSWLGNANNYRPLLASLFSVSIVIALSGFIVLWLSIKAKRFLKADVLSCINNRHLTDYLFKYFGLSPKYLYNETNDKIISYDVINFYKNVHNFNDLLHHNLICGKYELYEALTSQQYFKMQNLEYYDELWLDKSKIDKKLYKKLKLVNASEYKNKVQVTKRELRFGLAAKISNIDKNIALTLFDENKLYTPNNYIKVTLPTEFESLNLYAEQPQLLTKWIEEKGNLDYLVNLKNQLNKIVINNPLAKKQKNKPKNNPQNISLLLRNQEAFIWFETPTELLDLSFAINTLNKDKIIDILVNKILDDFYAIYLFIQLLAPFGYDLVLKIDKEVVERENAEIN
ncbi:MAG2810 family protein [Mycoplasmopsis primatum]|uniref:MAG2810 family protein n=1 Tax=Mycoplasmopsis primatum TaxID=55604 RepID=UPI0004961E28|nr:hypothetical protein [Mycoplasmopsis primatum]